MVWRYTYGIDNIHGMDLNSCYSSGTPESYTYKRVECYLYTFLDALASLGLMIETDSLTDSLTRRLEIDSPSDSSDSSDLITQNGMSLKMECHSK